MNGVYVAINNAAPSNSEAMNLFGELTGEHAITTIEQLASRAFSDLPSIAFRGAGVLVSLFTSSHLTQEVFIRSSLDMGAPVDGPPVTYALLL